MPFTGTTRNAEPHPASSRSQSRPASLELASREEVNPQISQEPSDNSDQVSLTMPRADGQDAIPGALPTVERPKPEFNKNGWRVARVIGWLLTFAFTIAAVYPAYASQTDELLSSSKDQQKDMLEVEQKLLATQEEAVRIDRLKFSFDFCQAHPSDPSRICKEFDNKSLDILLNITERDVSFKPSSLETWPPWLRPVVDDQILEPGDVFDLPCSIVGSPFAELWTAYSLTPRVTPSTMECWIGMPMPGCESAYITFPLWEYFERTCDTLVWRYGAYRKELLQYTCELRGELPETQVAELEVRVSVRERLQTMKFYFVVSTAWLISLAWSLYVDKTSGVFFMVGVASVWLGAYFRDAKAHGVTYEMSEFTLGDPRRRRITPRGFEPRLIPVLVLWGIVSAVNVPSYSWNSPWLSTVKEFVLVGFEVPAQKAKQLREPQAITPRNLFFVRLVFLLNLGFIAFIGKVWYDKTYTSVVEKICVGLEATALLGRSV